MFQPILSTTPDTFCLEQAESVRLQRLIQQRKRIEHMALLIEQQKQTIHILKDQIQCINKQFYQIKLQNQLLNDKLIVSSNHCQDLTEVVLKQISLIENLKGFLFGNLHLNEHQRNLLLNEIQTSLSLYQALQSGKASLNMFNHNNEISQLTQDHQILNQKYQQLCADYLELNKNLKVKEFQLMKYQNNNHLQKISNTETDQHACFHVKHKHQKNKPQNQQKSIGKIKDNEINDLKKKIQKMAIQISHKDQLIKQHRKNQKEQKKLLHFLKSKFNQEGKHLSQIAKSKQLIEPAPFSKTQVSYQIEKPTKNSTRKNQDSLFGNTTQTKIFQEKNLNLNQPTICQSSHSKGNLLQSPSVKQLNSGFKKTVSKCIIQP